MHTYTIYERGHNHGTNKKEAGGAEPRGGGGKKTERSPLEDGLDRDTTFSLVLKSYLIRTQSQNIDTR